MLSAVDVVLDEGVEPARRRPAALVEVHKQVLDVGRRGFRVVLGAMRDREGRPAVDLGVSEVLRLLTEASRSGCIR